MSPVEYEQLSHCLAEVSAVTVRELEILLAFERAFERSYQLTAMHGGCRTWAASTTGQS